MPALPSTVVGSYPQPDWLIDREKLTGRLPPRVPAHEPWRVDEGLVEEAQDDATMLAVRDMAEAGDRRRHGWGDPDARAIRTASQRALEGLDIDRPGTRARPDGASEPGAARGRADPASAARTELRDTEFLRAFTSRIIRVTVPGPFTMSQQAQNDHYPDLRSLALAFDAVNEELRELGGGRRRRPDRRAVPAGAP